MDFREFAEANRLRAKWNGAEHLVLGRYGELADMGDDGMFRLRLLAVPRGASMDRKLRCRRERAIAGGLTLRHRAEAESVFLFDAADEAHARLAVELVGAKRRRAVMMSAERREALSARMRQLRTPRAATSARGKAA